MIRVKDWKRFQHFKDRTPPWIKLYRDILDDPEYHALDPDAAKYLVLIWIIASDDKEKNGALPDENKLAFRLRITENKLNSILIKLSHWLIQDDINTISDGYQSDAPETEGETEKRREETDSAFGEFVRMTDAEYQKLVSKFGEADAKGRIDSLNHYIGSKGKRYRSHYHTILSWAAKDAPQGQKPPDRKCSFGNCTTKAKSADRSGNWFCALHIPY